MRARPPDLHVYDGRTLIGVLRERGTDIAAYSIINTYKPKLIGAFKTQRAAMRAIPNPNGARPIRAEESPVAVGAAPGSRKVPSHVRYNE